ncbi:hypothetical protein [Lutibacter sp.]|uniref:hypothetical protein n=1 Tax=Lutibacter sp. TaxID=1925666 RepID=UPI00356ABCB3
MFDKKPNNNPDFKKATDLANTFAELEGRRPRIMIAELGSKSQDNNLKIVATRYADLGFDVDIGSLFQTSKELVKQAIENDVHSLNILLSTTNHKVFIQQIIDELKLYGREDIMVVIHENIPSQNYEYLLRTGVKFIISSKTTTSKTAIDILTSLIKG